ncbi:DUF1622 domain-containing protein [Pseudonocardia sp. RS11V-5]|uniref:DUF1622 domain-containing protein n=1 Tax=Pseudonocardia terrae TaxID=2905831 RepID=UPI001E476118|nr:DUF1622 domain-containing protein [Pseudonocardia terrae]MCE3555488.1 DUF1622 domain-containing protein [Pseudonocardia terrae]
MGALAAGPETTVVRLMDGTAVAFEVLGAAVLVVGLVWSAVLSARVWRATGRGRDGYLTLRETFGGTLLLAIEVLVAADLLRTIAVEPTLQNVAILGLIVVIRTFLSFSLEIEIDGVPPWRRALTSGPERMVAAAVRGRDRTATSAGGSG